MKKRIAIIAKAATVFVFLLALVLIGCAPAQTGKPTMEYGENWEFVPSVHIEDDSFGTSAHQYYQCSYDLQYSGYWCLTR